MGAISRLFAPTAARSRPDDWDDHWYQSVPQETASGQDVTPESARQVAAVKACVRVIAETMGMLPGKVYKYLPRGREEAPNHPLWPVLRHAPNRWQTPQEWVEMMTGHVALRGNGVSLILPGARGAVDQLMPLDWDRMEVKRNPDLTLQYVYRATDGESWRFDQDQIFHLRGLSSDGVTGLSPVAEAAETIGLAMAAEQFGATLFKNKLMVGGILEHPGKLSPKALENLQRTMSEQHAGSDNWHKFLVAEEGMKWQSMSVSPEDAQFLETRKYLRSEIASLFRVPAHLINDLEKATFSNIVEQSLGFVIYTMLPWIVRWEQAIARCLLAEPEKYFVKFEVKALLRGNPKARNEAYAQAVNTGWMTRNEVRELEDMNPAEGLDDFLEPMNMRKPGQAERSQPATPEDEDEDDEAASEAVQASTVDVAATMKPLIEDAARRIATAETKALERRAHRASEDREKFNRWTTEYLTSHGRFVEELLNTIAESHQQLTGTDAMTSDRAKSLAWHNVLNTAESALALVEPVSLVARWKQSRAKEIVKIIGAALAWGDTNANG